MHPVYAKLRAAIDKHTEEFGVPPQKVVLTKAEAEQLRADLRIRPDSGPIMLKGVPVEEVDEPALT